MKKRVSCLFLGILVLIMIITACDNSGANSNTTLGSSAINSSTILGSSEKKQDIASSNPKLTSAQAMLLINNEPQDGVEKKSVDNVFGNVSIVTITSRNKDTQNLEYDESIFDLTTGNISPIRVPANLTRWQTASGSSVTMHNRYLYKWASYSDDSSAGGMQDNKLTCLDVEKQEIQVIETLSLNTPFIFLSKLNEDEFISSYCTIENKSEKTTTVSVISKYNIKTGMKTEIIHESYRNEESWKNSEGILLENITAIDNKIYAFGRTRENSQYRYYLYVYDTNGKLEEKRSVQGLADILDNAQMYTIYVIGNYLMFVTWESSSYYIYKMGTNSIEQKMKGEYSKTIFTVSDDSCNSSDFPYIYYYNTLYTEDSKPNYYVYGIEQSTGKAKCIELALHKEKKNIYDMKIDGRGNAIFTVTRNLDDSDNSAQFYVSRQTLFDLFTKAPYVN